DLLGGQRRLRHVALFIRRAQIIDEHRNSQTFQPARRLFRIGDRAIDLVIARGLTRRVVGRRYDVRSSGVLIGRVRRGSRCGTWRQRDARRGGLVRQRARYALRTRAVAARLLGRLLAAHDLTIRPILLARLFGRRELDVRDDLRAHAADADERREQRLDAARVTLLQIARDLELFLANRKLVVASRRR